MVEDKSLSVRITKADKDRGLVFGLAIVCKKDGQPYYDLQGDYIPESTMLDASIDFMANSRAAGEMHKSAGGELSIDGKKRIGDVLFAFPMTEDIGESFGMRTPTTGLMIGMKIEDQDVLGKFHSGEYKGFSIEGKRLVQDILGEDGQVEKTEDFTDHVFGKGAERSYTEVHDDKVIGSKRKRLRQISKLFAEMAEAA